MVGRTFKSTAAALSWLQHRTESRCSFCKPMKGIVDEGCAFDNFKLRGDGGFISLRVPQGERETIEYIRSIIPGCPLLNPDSTEGTTINFKRTPCIKSSFGRVEDAARSGVLSFDTTANRDPLTAAIESDIAEINIRRAVGSCVSDYFKPEEAISKNGIAKNIEEYMAMFYGCRLFNWAYIMNNLYHLVDKRNGKAKRSIDGGNAAINLSTKNMTREKDNLRKACVRAFDTIGRKIEPNLIKIEIINL